MLPAGIGAHPDHVLLRESVYLLTRADDAPPVTYCADLPYALRFGPWPEIRASHEPQRDADVLTLRMWQTDLAHSRPRLQTDAAVVCALNAAEIDAKRRAIQCHATQVDALDQLAGGRLLTDDTLGYEVFWHVDAGTLDQ